MFTNAADKGMLHTLSKDGLILWYIARAVSTALRLLQPLELPCWDILASITDSIDEASERVLLMNRVDWTGNRACTATKRS